MQTRDLHEANVRKHVYIAKWKKQFAELMAEGEGTLASEIRKTATAYRAMVEAGTISERTRLGFEEFLDSHNPEIWDKPNTNDEEANAALKHAYKVLEDPAIEDGSDTLSEALKAHLKGLATRSPPSTVDARKRYVTAFMAWLPGGSFKPLDSITRRDASKYRDERLMTSDRSITTQNNTLSHISTFFTWAVDSGYSESNPFHALRIRKPIRGEKKEERHEWSKEDLIVLLKGIKEHRKPTDPLWPLTVIALFTGMRGNEIASLEIADVHLGGKTPYLHIGEGKTESSIRDIPIHPALLPMMNDLTNYSTDGFLISGLKEGGKDKKKFHNQSKRFGTLTRSALKIKDKGLVFHSLRNTFTGSLERAGIAENVIQQIIGHKKKSLAFNTYSDGMHLGQLMEAVEKVNYGREINSIATKQIQKPQT